MSSDVRRNAAAPVSNGQWEPVVAISVAVGGIILFFAARNALHYILLGADPFRIGIIYLLSMGLTLSFVWIRYNDVPALLARLTRLSAVGVLVYVLVEPPFLTLANPDAAELAALLELLYWPSVAAGILAIWRPSFAILPVILIFAVRDTVSHVSGFKLSSLDVKYMMEMMLVLCGSVVLIGGLGKKLKSSLRWELASTTAYVAIGLHLANYFWSGVAKVILGPEPWTWALENMTPYMMLGALDRGVLPTGPWPLLTQTLYSGFLEIYLISNVFVLITQLTAVVVILRLAWLRLATLAYDLLHLGIYVFGGLFFWPWIWNNFSILVALRGKRDEAISYAPKLACIITIGLGGFHELGSAARLAWWDVPEMKHGSFELRIGEDAEWVSVPVSFWMSHSYAVSHGYQDMSYVDGHYPPSIWGSVADYERFQTAGTCPKPVDLSTSAPLETASERADRLMRVEALVRAHHEKMSTYQRDIGEIVGLPWFYLRSHHHPSVPWLHSDFNAVDLHNVTHYRLVTRSYCLSMDGGRLERHIWKEDEEIFDVRR